MARSNEPAVWALFSAGGVVTAFFMPAIALILSGWFGGRWLSDHHAVGNALAHPVVKVALIGFIMLALFHALHRFRFVLLDLGVHGHRTLIAAIAYALATAGTAWAVWILFFAQAVAVH